MERKVFFIFLVAIYLIPCSAASFLMELSSDVPHPVTGNTASINVSVVNKGDEEAYKVYLSPILPEHFGGGEVYIGSLKPGKKFRGVLNVSIPGDAPQGSYPVAIMLYYMDVHGYPFSTVFPETLSLGRMSAPRLFGVLGEVNVSPGGEALLSGRVINRERTPINVSVRLITPREIYSREPERELTVNPLSEEPISFGVSPLGALPGSNYLVLASLTYTLDGLQYSEFLRGRVLIVPHSDLLVRENPFKPEYAGAALAAILVILFLFERYVRKR